MSSNRSSYAERLARIGATPSLYAHLVVARSPFRSDEAKHAMYVALLDELERDASAQDVRKAFALAMHLRGRRAVTEKLGELLGVPEVFSPYVRARFRAVSAGNAPPSFVSWFMSAEAAKHRAAHVRAAQERWLELQRIERRERQVRLFEPWKTEGYSTAGVITSAVFESYAGGFERLAGMVGFSGLPRADVARMLDGDVDVSDGTLLADVLDWAEGSADESMFMVLCGLSSIGKTFAAITWLSTVEEPFTPDYQTPGAMGRYAINSRDLVDIRRTERMGIPPRNNGTWSRGGWDEIMRARALVIDEVFATDAKIAEEREVLHEVVNARRVGGDMRTVFTSNRPWSHLGNPRNTYGLSEPTLSRLHGMTAVRGDGRREDLRRSPPPRVGRDRLHERFAARASRTSS